MTVLNSSWKTISTTTSQPMTNVNALASKDGNFYVATGWRINPVADVVKITPTGEYSVVGSLSTARYDVASCIVEENGKEYIYVFGGQNGGVYARMSQKLDLETGEVTRPTYMPTGREDATAVHLDGKIYVIGGANGSPLNLVEVYDIATNTWETGVPTTYTHSAHSAVAYDGKIYVIGGRGTGAGKLEVFDPATGVWTEKTGMPVSLWHHGADEFQGHIFVMNGENDNNQWNASPNKLYVYEVAKDTWTELTPPSSGFDRHGFAFQKPKQGTVGKAYAFLGWDVGFNADMLELTVEVDEAFRLGYRQSHGETSYKQDGGAIKIHTIAGNEALGLIDNYPIEGATVTHEIRLLNADGTSTRYKTLTGITGADGRTVILNVFNTNYPKGEYIIATTITAPNGESVRFKGFNFTLV